MIKINPKYWQVSIIAAIIPFVMLNAGCFLFSSTTGKLIAVEENVDFLIESMESLNATNSDFEVKLKELISENERLSEEHEGYKEIKEELLEARNSISEINQKLIALDYKLSIKDEEEKNVYRKDTIVEKAKKVEKRISSPKKVGKKKERVEVSKKKPAKKKPAKEKRTKEKLTKETQDMLKSSLVEKLFNRAKTLYRQGKYEEAIAKWERALVLDPTKIDAMFNIEVAKDRIKEKQSKSEE